jgi:Ca2+-binding RTX toxin-like protein
MTWGANRRRTFSGRFGYSTQVFDAEGQALTPERQLSVWNYDSVARPEADANAAGDAAVIAGYDNDQGFTGLVSRRFAASGEPAGPTVSRASPFTGSLVDSGDAAVAPGGETAFVLEYWNFDNDPDGADVFGRLEDRNGQPIGGSFVVNRGRIDGYQQQPSVAWTDAGEFVVVFRSGSTSSSNREFDAGDGDGAGIFAQRFNATPATHTPTPTITPTPTVTPTPTITPTATPVPRLLCRGEQVTIFGTSRDEVIRGTSAADVIDGRGGSDRIFGGEGADTICGGAGRDVLFGEDGDDVLDGGAGRDGLTGGPGDDALRGGRANDTCRGEDGADSFRGCETVRDD